MQHVDRGSSSIQRTESLNLVFSPGTIGMWLRSEHRLPNVKPSSVLPWLKTVINQNAEQQLALC